MEYPFFTMQYIHSPIRIGLDQIEIGRSYFKKNMSQCLWPLFNNSSRGSWLEVIYRESVHHLKRIPVKLVLYHDRDNSGRGNTEFRVELLLISLIRNTRLSGQINVD